MVTPNAGTDVSPYCNAATYPKNPPCTSTGSANSHKTARSRHPSGVAVVMADGSMRFVTNNISLTSWRALGTMDGGETVSD